ncbi:MAG: CHAT domain-containing protein [Bacteroidetes bacterium]|nr:CHAT domain-containing protein [Bacteroidota bacterium]
MKLVRKFIIPFILLFLQFHNISYGQKIDSILKLYNRQTKELYVSRGEPWEPWKGKVNISTIQRLLGQFVPNVGMVFYVYSQDTLIISLISKNGLVAQNNTIIPKDSLASLANSTRNAYSRDFSSRRPAYRGSKSLEEEKIQDVSEISKLLCNILLPFPEELKAFDHLIIVPALNIGTVPFASLKPWNTNEYLIDRMSYSIAPSLNEVVLLSERYSYGNHSSTGQHQRIKFQWDSALLVGNPAYPKDSKWVFPDLPGAEKEVSLLANHKSIKKYTLLTQEQATKERVLDLMVHSDLWYFATHGIADSQDPLNNSFLVLAGNSEQGSFLTAKEIQSISEKMNQKKIDLVILSACQTGLGKSHEAGMIGLARAFHIAGARDILMSLCIDDKETAKLMNLFFDYLEEGGFLMPHEALRKAILKYKSEINPSPSYWAAFSIFGMPY